ncbi:hypothetical protein [Bacteroides acidifaciens]|uniref:hypothetical protein n=2 Tax=Bacteroides acidifaciens TaxID=85831 RepID=UPI00258D2824|nr:hypothetical protein [Bacteroides acidifaciens]
MNTKKLLHRYPLLLILIAFIVASVAVSCGSNPEIDRQLTKAEDIMEQHPDSAYMLLNGIDKETLSTKKEKARYALLMSMALDRNYIETTSFDVIQPAIDYYLKSGNPNEQLRTYYYQGRIFQNKKDLDNALNSFVKGINNSLNCTDSLTLIRTLVAQAYLYYEFYDFDSYTNANLRAATICKKLSHKNYEFQCLLNALNGAIVLENKNLADSLINLCNSFESLSYEQDKSLLEHQLSYDLKFGSKQDLASLLSHKNELLESDINCTLNLAAAYNKLGDNHKSKDLLDYISNQDINYDTLKYQSIYVAVLKDIGDYKNALSIYEDFSRRVDALNSIKFDQKAQSIEEKHDLELKAQEKERQKSQIIWCSISIVLLLCIIILANSLYVKRIKTEHTNDLLKIRNLQDSLFERDRRQEAMSNKIGGLFSTRFKLLDGLASSYFECKETGQEQKRIYSEVKNSLSDFSSDATTQELIDVVNGYKNGLMDNFKSDYPKLSASQYRLALYLFCGFSLPSISIFIGSDLRNLYVYKSRLKSVIAKGDTPRKEEYLKYFA